MAPARCLALALVVLLLPTAAAAQWPGPPWPEGRSNRELVFGQEALGAGSDGDCFATGGASLVEAPCATAGASLARRAAYTGNPTFERIVCRLGGSVTPSAAGETITLALVFSDGATQSVSTWSATIGLDAAAAGDLWSASILEVAPLSDATVTLLTLFSNGATVFSADAACVLRMED